MNLLQALEAFGMTTGDYWSQANARFEQGNPSTIDRVVRAVNPMTGFGSALGAMSDAASKGLPPVDTGVAVMQSLPLFGAAIAKGGVAASGAIKAIPAVIKNDYLKTLGGFAAGTAASVAADEAQEADYGKRPEMAQQKRGIK